MCNINTYRYVNDVSHLSFQESLSSTFIFFPLNNWPRIVFLIKTDGTSKISCGSSSFRFSWRYFYRYQNWLGIECECLFVSSYVRYIKDDFGRFVYLYICVFFTRVYIKSVTTSVHVMTHVNNKKNRKQENCLWIIFYSTKKKQKIIQGVN